MELSKTMPTPPGRLDLRHKDRKILESVLYNLERAQQYLLKDRTLVCSRKNGPATTTLDFTNQQGEVCVAVNKEYGSELAMFHTGISMLQKALDQTPAPVEESAAPV
jgi:hypothetical protein